MLAPYDKAPPPGCLTAVKRCFGVDIRSVRTLAVKGLRYHGIAGFTHGNCMVLDKTAWNWNHHSNRQLWGHELTHVLQNRRDANKSQTCSLRHQLEAEADAGGLALANDLPFQALVNQPKADAHQIYFSVVIGEKHLTSIDQLNQIARQILALIPLGIDWLCGAITNPSQQRVFATENDMLSAIQEGLHDSPTMYLPQVDLLIAPARLAAMGDDFTENILAKLAADKLTASERTSLIKSCRQAGLLSYREVEKTWTYLDTLNVQSAPIFSAISLTDQIVLFEKVTIEEHTSTSAALARAAANFAAEFAQSPQTFADLFRFFLALNGRLGNTRVNPAKQAALRVFENLIPHVMRYLSGPCVGPTTNPQALQTALHSAVRSGIVFPGFRRVSQAACLLAQFTDLAEQKRTTLASLVHDYCQAAREFVLTTTATTCRLSQDGERALFQLADTNREAQLQVDADGTLTLNSFNPSSALEPDPHPDAEDEPDTSAQERTHEGGPNGQ